MVFVMMHLIFTAFSFVSTMYATRTPVLIETVNKVEAPRQYRYVRQYPPPPPPPIEYWPSWLPPRPSTVEDYDGDSS